MQQENKSDSRHASIHDIISENKRKLHKQEINQLFCPPDLTEMDLTQFHHHPYMISNDMFTFFVHELERWNRKIRNKERYLEELTVWYNKNSCNVPKPNVLMKRYNPSEEWEIRKTFKSNTPSEIGHYRRRFLCSPDQKDGPFGGNFLQFPKKKQNCFFEAKSYNNKTFIRTKTLIDDIQEEKKCTEPFQQIMKNKETKLTKIQHNQIREKRQRKEMVQVQDSWKTCHSRFQEKSCKNFFKGKFIKSKQFSEVTARIQERKVRTAAFKNRRVEETELINSVKKGRIRTSLGIRKNFEHEQKQANSGYIGLLMKTQSNEESKDESTANWIDRFNVDEDKIDIRNTFNCTGPGMALISNPFDVSKNKIKKKKR